MNMYVNWDELIKHGDLVESKHSGSLGIVVECYHYPTNSMRCGKRAWALCTVRWIDCGVPQNGVPDNQLIKLEPSEEK